ncbi:MAG TPA: DNA-binding response regulator [Planctomycetaceae bacterium]|nr:DNA-binding response regulator [Planctomycetaceae bacterium]
MNHQERSCRILLIDEHPVVREGIKAILKQDSTMGVCGEADGLRSSLSQWDELKPDMALVEIALRDADGLDLVRRLHARDQRVPILVVSGHEERLFAERALSAGARGYISKRAAPRELLQAVNAVSRNTIYLSEEIKNQMLTRVTGRNGTGQGPERQSRLNRLSDRELEVFRLLGQGRTTNEIATLLRLSRKTVETHRLHIRDKLSLTDGNKLIQAATHFVMDESRFDQFEDGRSETI